MTAAILAVACGLLGLVMVIVGTVFLQARTKQFLALPHSTEVFDPPQARYGQPFFLIGVGIVLVCVAIVAAVVAFV